MVTRLLPPVARSTSRVPRPDDPLPRRPNSIYASPGRKGTKRGHNRQDESPERDKERSKKKGKIILPDKHLSSTATGRMPFSRTQTMPALVFGGVGTVRDRAPSPAFINNGALLQAMGGLRRSTMARSHSRGSSISSVAIEDDVFKVPDPVVHAPLKGNIVRASGGSQESDAVREVSELELANKNVRFLLPVFANRDRSNATARPLRDKQLLCWRLTACRRTIPSSETCTIGCNEASLSHW